MENKQVEVEMIVKYVDATVSWYTELCEIFLALLWAFLHQKAYEI